MSIKPFFFRSALGAALLAAATALPAVAHANDRDHRDHRDHRDYYSDRYDRDNDHRWEHRSHWNRGDFYRDDRHFRDRHHHASRGYWRYHRGHRVYYVPVYAYPPAHRGATIVYRRHWE